MQQFAFRGQWPTLGAEGAIKSNFMSYMLRRAFPKFRQSIPRLKVMFKRIMTHPHLLSEDKERSRCGLQKRNANRLQGW